MTRFMTGLTTCLMDLSSTWCISTQLSLLIRWGVECQSCCPFLHWAERVHKSDSGLHLLVCITLWKGKYRSHSRGNLCMEVATRKGARKWKVLTMHCYVMLSKLFQKVMNWFDYSPGPVRSTVVTCWRHCNNVLDVAHQNSCPLSGVA